MLSITQLLSNHLNELRRLLTIHPSDQPFPMQSIAGFAQASSHLVADLVSRSVETELVLAGRNNIREAARERLTAQVESLERMQKRIEAACGDLITRIEGSHFVLPEYPDRAPAQKSTIAGDAPVGRLSELDDAALLGVIWRGYEQLLRRRGRLEWGAPERGQSLLDFHYGAGQTLVYVGEKLG
jgi:hypothetical protein